MTRRTVLSALAATTAAAQTPTRRPAEWKPKLGILGPYTEANVRFAKEEGFTNMIFGATPKSTMDALVVTDAQLEEAKKVLAKYQMNVSAFQASHQHIDPDPAKHKANTDYFIKLIENAGKMGIPYIGTSSGRNASLSFEKQVDEIVRTYTERYFPACEKNKVRILWEPYPSDRNIAISPQGFDALFKAFGDSPYVGLQQDPSHFVR
jgi:sugar phosphate isomerase/epimerase